MVNRIKNMILWLLGICLIITMWASSSGQMKDRKMSGMDINVNVDDGNFFVNADDVKQVIKNMIPGIDTMKLTEINSRLLEESIENHPSIARAEVYSALNGNLRVDVYQRKPIAR